VRILRLRRRADLAFDAYALEVENNPQTTGLALFDGPCHCAWHQKYREYSTEFHAYLASYGIPPTSLLDIYPQRREGV